MTFLIKKRWYWFFFFFEGIPRVYSLHVCMVIVRFCFFVLVLIPNKMKSFFFPFPALTSFKTKCCLSIVEMVKQNCSITYCRTSEYSFIRWRIEFQSVLSLISHFALVFDSEWNQVHSLAKVPRSQVSFKYIMAFFLMIARAFSSKRGEMKGNYNRFLAWNENSW